MIKIIFDLDGTLTAQETLPLIAKHFNIEDEIARLTRETVQGNVPFVESFIKRVHLLKILPVDEIARLLSTAPLYQELKKFIENNSEKCAIATGNLDCWTLDLLESFGCDFYCSHAEVEHNKIVKVAKILRKEVIVEMYQKKGYKVVFIGDGNNDQEAMRTADISIASGLTHYPAKSILEIADYAVFGEGALCRLIKQLL